MEVERKREEKKEDSLEFTSFSDEGMDGKKTKIK